MKLLTWKSFLLHLPLNNERGKSFADWLNRDLEKCLLVNEENGSSRDLTPNEKIVLVSVILTSKFNRAFILVCFYFYWISSLPEYQHLSPRVQKLGWRLHTRLFLCLFSIYIHKMKDSPLEVEVTFDYKCKWYCLVIQVHLNIIHHFDCCKIHCTKIITYNFISYYYSGNIGFWKIIIYFIKTWNNI